MKPPISEPFELASSPSPTPRIFRIDLLHGFIGIFCFYFLIFMPVLPPVFAPMQNNNEVSVSLAITLVAAVAATGLWSIFPTQVTDNGLRGYNFWGAKRELKWAEISRVRRGWFIFSYALLSTPRKRNFIWLPLLLRDMKGFSRAVEEWAPDDNPLRLFLQQRGF